MYKIELVIKILFYKIYKQEKELQEWKILLDKIIPSSVFIINKNEENEASEIVQ